MEINIPLRILIVADNCKGTLTTGKAAQAIACGWAKTRLLNALEVLPISDWGDGFVDVIVNLLGARDQFSKKALLPPNDTLLLSLPTL